METECKTDCQWNQYCFTTSENMTPECKKFMKCYEECRKAKIINSIVSNIW